ncbi:hypothetical protein GLV94_12885 [Virgibacillus halodenitrificans]|uniref:YlbD family protein n=1 Tax=Virgibacillus halodenitrificans TaxID=1482 RepID=A0AAC9NKR7_VIRHA|nr:spore coat protein YlbD [Virgibacillus halodenitrificans]APC48742.1 hypothetical protein BME96_11325 [Virgibacillus halodenitrificans]MBD1224606.1 YlbD family protein [Virgibacillus halodenitrificans]MCG1029762.1 YlbD family protein [Virgibacillus halodenitrificans]MEC2160186.1 spore coat protein YlbD [Virgibacillus halodenitrificans]MYL46537.1 hypothetical protein [Virgibacillus halodenitrificans]
MNESDLHPSVVNFKRFINKHPKLLKEIRRSGKSLQVYYEKWALLGEEDSYWDQFIEEKPEAEEEDGDKKNKELFNQFLKMAENMDIEKIQKQANQLSNAITTVQEIISQFQSTKSTGTSNQNPINWYRD